VSLENSISIHFLGFPSRCFPGFGIGKQARRRRLRWRWEIINTYIDFAFTSPFCAHPPSPQRNAESFVVSQKKCGETFERHSVS